MDSLKNKQAAKNRQKEIKKVVTLRAQGGGSLAMSHHVSKERKHAFDAQSSDKGASGSSTQLETCEVATDVLRQGPVVPPLLSLLMKDKEYAVDTTHSIV